MTLRSKALILPAFLAGAVFGVLLFGRLGEAIPDLSSAARAQALTEKPDEDVDSQADGRRPVIAVDEALVMRYVDYHTQNLWFAGSSQNWALADYYWKQTLLNLRRSARVRAVHKNSSGREVSFDEILKSIEESPQMKVGEAIQKQDPVKFSTSYRYLLEGCYYCHKEMDMPFLRPKVPQPPAPSIINFNPNASWPK